MVASERQPRCVGRARLQVMPSKRISTHAIAVIQCSDGELSVPNESVIINCASLYAFCNDFQVKMYDIITA